MSADCAPHFPRLLPGAGRRDRRRRAFTLVEMLLVMVIIAVLAGSVVVSLGGRTDKYATRTAANDVAAAVRFAAGAARLERRPHRLVFAEDGGGFHVEARDEASREFRAVTGLAGGQRRLPQDVRVVSVLPGDGPARGPGEPLEFEGDGTGFFGRIELQAHNLPVASVVVSAETGQAYVEQPDARAAAAPAR